MKQLLRIFYDLYDIGLTYQDQLEIFLNTMDQYESMVQNNEKNDDMTIVGFEI